MDPILFQKILINLYGPFSPQQAESKARLVAAEKRLGVRLPKILRDYYLLAGKDKRLNESHNRLLPLDDLLLEEDALVFFVENQAEVVWGIFDRDLTQTDPPVYRAENSGGVLAWQLDHRCLSDFLITMACWQAVAGGMPASGIAAVDLPTADTIRAHWQRLSIGENAWGLQLFTGNGQVLILLNDAKEGMTLLAAARTKEDFAAIGAALNLTWQEQTLPSEEDQP